LYVIAVVAMAGVLCACAETPRFPPIPATLVSAATVPGFPAVRQWGDDESETAASPGRPPGSTPAAAAVPSGPLNALAISGGGANGSFAAGLLTGWSIEGTRPQFHVVTGVSVGALAAPFVFLGSQHDAVLQTLFTHVSRDDIIRTRPRLLAFLGDSLASPQPLQALIERYIDATLMHAIAAEHRKGRRLFVATTHVYAGRQVIWNIGAIAADGRPEALELIRRVMLASASIPVLLPPVYIDVEAAGRQFSEMHVDGGIARQVFIAPPKFDWVAAARELGTDGRINFWVIRNGRATSEYMMMRPDVIGLAEHATQQLTQSLGIGDLHMIYLRAEREKAAFRAAWIGADFDAPWNEWFDPAYAKALFEYGRARARSPNAWHFLPPGVR
jgi:hypothetical protein